MKERTEVNPAQNLALALCGTNFRNQVPSTGSRPADHLSYGLHLLHGAIPQFPGYPSIQYVALCFPASIHLRIISGVANIQGASPIPA